MVLDFILKAKVYSRNWVRHVVHICTEQKKGLSRAAWASALPDFVFDATYTKLEILLLITPGERQKSRSLGYAACSHRQTSLDNSDNQ